MVLCCISVSLKICGMNGDDKCEKSSCSELAVSAPKPSTRPENIYEVPISAEETTSIVAPTIPKRISKNVIIIIVILCTVNLAISLFCLYKSVGASAPQERLSTDGQRNVRLASSKKSYSGQVEIFHGGRWMTICDDESWDLRDARVICHMLGFCDALSDTSFDLGQGSGQGQGRGRGQVLLSNVRCQGDEKSILDCNRPGQDDDDCDEGNYASVTCAHCNNPMA